VILLEWVSRALELEHNNSRQGVQKPSKYPGLGWYWLVSLRENVNVDWKLRNLDTSYGCDPIESQDLFHHSLESSIVLVVVVQRKFTSFLDSRAGVTADFAVKREKTSF